MTNKLFIFLVFGLAGAGFYFSGAHVLDRFAFFDTEERVSKKISVVKPKHFRADRMMFRRLSAYDKENYSFFTVLNDPSMNNMVGLNGKIIKVNSSLRPATPQVKTAPKETIFVPPIRVKNGKGPKALSRKTPARTTRAVSRPQPKPVKPQKAKTRTLVKEDFPGLLSFVVQVSSFRQKEHAEAFKSSLYKKGYPSFIGKTELPGNRGIWHRVYIGRYMNRAGAERAAAKFQNKEKRQAMVIRQAS